jgi:phage tail P2-like protein
MRVADDRLIPVAVKDDSAAAYNEMAERLGTLDITCLLVYMVDIVPAGALPYLAEQFDVSGNAGWLLADTEEARRSLIKSAIDLHRYKGTEYALRRAIDVLGLTYTVEKWWEYGADPYHFRVTVDVLDSGVSADQQALLTAFIDEYKALRDVQDAMQFNLSAPGGLYVGVSHHSHEVVTVYPLGLEVTLTDEANGQILTDETTGQALKDNLYPGGA